MWHQLTEYCCYRLIDTRCCRTCSSYHTEIIIPLGEFLLLFTFLKLNEVYVYTHSIYSLFCIVQQPMDG